MIIEFYPKKQPNLFQRIWIDLSYIAFFNIGIYIGSPKLFNRYSIYIELVILLLLLLKLSNYRSRIITKLAFNDSISKLTIYYYQFILFKFVKTIDYNNLYFQYRYKAYRRSNIPKTLEIFNSGKIICEFRENQKIGWHNKDIKLLMDKLKQIQDEKKH